MKQTNIATHSARFPKRPEERWAMFVSLPFFDVWARCGGVQTYLASLGRTLFIFKSIARLSQTEYVRADAEIQLLSRQHVQARLILVLEKFLSFLNLQPSNTNVDGL